jgi:hypothetical protein
MVFSKKIISLLVISWFANGSAAAQRLIVQIAKVPRDTISSVARDFSAAGSGEKLPSFLTAPANVGGIQVNYAGNRRFTEKDGRASFVLAHNSKNITLVIATQVFPRILSGATVDHFALWDKQKPAKLNVALFELQRDKNANKGWTWTVSEKPIPEDGKIANTAIIVQANPDSIVMPLGQVNIKQKDQVLLPAMFLLDRDGVDKAILYDLGAATLNPEQPAKYNLLQNLRDKVTQHVKKNVIIEVRNVSDEAV